LTIAFGENGRHTSGHNR